MRIFDSIKNLLNKKQSVLQVSKTRYQQFVESIDDWDLAKNFKSSVPYRIKSLYNNFNNSYNYYEHPLKTRIKKDDMIELTKEFFEYVDSDIAKNINDIIDGNNSEVQLKMELFNGRGSEVSDPNQKPVEVYVPIRDDIRMLYEFVHELTHTLDVKNGDTETRKVLGEVAPQCMERLLDSFLLNMSDDEMNKYGFDKKVLNRDIKVRQVTTFLSRYNNAMLLYNKNGNRVIDLRYMLAQIYSAQFNKFTIDEKRNKLKKFIENVSNDKFEEANNTFGMKILRENEKERKLYISDAMEEMNRLVKPFGMLAYKVKKNRKDYKDIENEIIK